MKKSHQEKGIKIHPKPEKKQQEEPHLRALIIAKVNRGFQIMEACDNTIQDLMKEKNQLLKEKERSFQLIDEINAQIEQLNTRMKKK